MAPHPLYAERGPMRLAVSMSGKGSNTGKIIEHYLDFRDRHARIPYEPVLITTDNPDSSAVRIGTKDYLDRGFTLPVICHSLPGFYRMRGRDDTKDKGIRAEYDHERVKDFDRFKVDCVALAGDDWKKTKVFCNTFLTVNVHPGDLRVRYTSGKDAGKPKYVGLAWIPSAAAIMAGENEVRTSVHIVTPKLDCGPVLAVSVPQPVPKEVLSLEDRTVLLGKAKSIREISDFIKAHPDVKEEQLNEMFPVYKHAVDCQDRLKRNGDWVIFPRTLQYIGEGRYARDENGDIYFEGNAIPNGLELS